MTIRHLPMILPPALLKRCGDNLVRHVAIDSMVVFRIGFGLLMAGWAFDYLRTDRVRFLFTVPAFHFAWDFFPWLKPWPGHGMTLQFALMMLAALLIAAGAFYRVSTAVFAVGFSHFFLLDRTNYQNHYYLILLLSWIMVVLPANRAFSVDAFNGTVCASRRVPRWSLLLLQFQIAVPYFYGGLAKFDADWLSGDPMRFLLMQYGWFQNPDGWLDVRLAAGLLTWGGLLFDLLIVPLLLWPPARLAAFSAVLIFHLMNSLIFRIHVFPWLMLVATTILFAPDWPHRLIDAAAGQVARKRRSDDSVAPTVPYFRITRREQVTFVLLAVYCLFQVSWPLRHLLYDGETGWTERGHCFSWRMMLRGKTTGVRFYVTDSGTDATYAADVRPYLNSEQLGKFARDPENILDMAHFLAAEHGRRLGRPVRVHALALTSLNGRKPQLLIDPAVDLAAQPRAGFERSWIVPLTEPRRELPWTVPLNQWERHVQLPDLPFLQRELPDKGEDLHDKVS